MRDPKNVLILVLASTTAFLAGAVLSRTEPAAAQQAPVSSGSGNGGVSANGRMIAATGTVGSGMSVLWLVDTETKRVLVYGTNSLGKNVELRAARNVTWDLGLDYLNDDSQYKVEDLRNLAERRHRENAPRAPEKPDDGADGGRK